MREKIMPCHLMRVWMHALEDDELDLGVFLVFILN